MRILIINPNSSLEMAAAIQKTALDFADGEFEVVTECVPEAPAFIDTYRDKVECSPGMMRLVREKEAEFDGFVIACHCDPGLDAMKEMTAKPMIGIGEASMKIATMLGHSFSVVSSAKHSVPNKEALAHKYHLDGMLASIRAPEKEMTDFSNEDILLEMGRQAVEEDDAEVIVLGCAGMSGLDKRLQEKLGVPVLDGVMCALVLAVGLAKYGIGTSKVRRYNPLSD